MTQFKYQIRPIQPKDREVCYRIFCSTRPDLMLGNFSEEERESLMRMQFHAQDQHYSRCFPGAEFWLITSGDQVLGRIYRWIGEGEIRLMEFSLLPCFRGNGFGTRILMDFLEDAQVRGLPVRLQVEFMNPALRLYQRLGFEITDHQGFHYLMERCPRKIRSTSPIIGAVMA